MANPVVNGLRQNSPHHMVASLIPLCGTSESVALWIQVSILYVKAKSYLLSFETISSTLLPFLPLSMASIAQETMVWVHFVHLIWMTSSEKHSVPLHLEP